MSTIAPEIYAAADRNAPAPQEPPFGVNEMRLTGRQWIATIIIFVAFAIIAPRAWNHFEPFHPGRDYRMPYVLSKDYWLFERRLQNISDQRQIPLLGDSVIWGEYVRPEGTLSHFLNEQTNQPDRFLNCGVNGMFPLALEGLVRNYGKSLHDRKIILQYNMLWMTSPRADLSEPKPQSFNHSRLVPQFWPRIPSYDADFSERISATLDHHVQLYAWSLHLQNAYYDQRSMPEWTLKEDESDPPRLPNAWRSPLAPFKDGIPTEPPIDPERGPTSRRHKPWNADGAEPTQFEWVDLDHSLQWQAFQRLVDLLRNRGNDVLVIVGPLNEHMIETTQRPQYEQMRTAIGTWLRAQGVATILPPTLPSPMYADTSHPLTQGYDRLAKDLLAEEAFAQWSR
ncbi:MAG TPA: hypothetical protein VH370_17540 [Humisphaera sp.]|jgi:hypothetical protein|nr:hypothetical protein [Humisphaera sp.]